MRTFLDIDYEVVKPFGANVVVEVPKPEEKTKGGLIITAATQETEKFANVVGKIVSMGAHAFKTNVAGNIFQEDVAVGDHVVFKAYAGELIEQKHAHDEGRSDFRLMPSGSILCRLPREGE